MIERLILNRFKAFERFDIPFAPMTILVGPNNAGKSTAVAALRAGASMLRHARRVRPTAYREHDGSLCRAFPFVAGQFDLEEDNLRFEFQPVQTSFELRMSRGAKLNAVWPNDEQEESGAFFYISNGGRQLPWAPSDVRSSFPMIGSIPVLSPLDRHEPLLKREYVLRNIPGRLSSRHFRNQLLILKGEGSETHPTRLLEFLDFCKEWLPELVIDEPAVRMDSGGAEIDLYYIEGRTPKEIVWAGDGIQIFIQLLLHIFRLRDADTIILDEPDVFLHADLQRRLLRLLLTMSGQVIFATHSAEMIVEAPPGSVVLVDRSRHSAIATPDSATLTEISRSLGTGFNLPLARVLRARVVAFVEGNDMSIIRNLAKTIGANSFVTEANTAIVPLEGAANTQRLVSFRWLADNLLQGTVAGYVLLDRDYRSDEAVDILRSQLTDSGLTPHVWARKELENYLLHPAAIARLSGAPEGAVSQMLDEISDGMQNFVAFRMTTSRYEDRGDRRLSFASVGAACELEARNRWTDPEKRLWACPGKDVISELNKRLQAAHFKAVSAKALSRALLPEEIPSELSAALLTIHRASFGRPRRLLRGPTAEPASPAVDDPKRRLVGAARKPK